MRIKESTLFDVAAASGVAVSTVSRVLNGASARVSAQTRARILESAKSLRYSPNPIARGLRMARTYTIAIGVPELENPVFPELIRGVIDGARDLGYRVLITYYDDTGAEAAGYEHLARANQVDGLLVATLEGDEPLARALKRTSLPFVVLNRMLGASDNHVIFDGAAAARMATEHLLALGHRRIAHLSGRSEGFNGGRRLAGYRSALEAAGIAFDPTLVVKAGYSAEGGESAMRELLARQTDATSIVAATTVAAAGAMKVLHEIGARLPEEWSIVGIHDVNLASMLFPPLTTVRLPLRELGERGARSLIGLINGEVGSIATVLLPEALVQRASTIPRSQTRPRS